jgi:hypothetical protein
MSGRSNTQASPVRCRVGDRQWRGRAIDLTGVDVAAETIHAAVPAAAPVDCDSGGCRVAVSCPEPASVYERVGLITPETAVRVRTALALAGRSRGLETPHDDALAEARADLAALSGEGGSDGGKDEIDETADAAAVGDGGRTAREARRRLAELDGEVERLRERVAAVRGRLNARREAGGETADLEAELADSVQSLSERETERVAARETLNRVRDQRRGQRSRRERRLALEDRIANLERAARVHLVDELSGEYAAAVAGVPEAGSFKDPFDADAVTAALAVAQVAQLQAPVVSAVRRFPTAEAAAGWLDAPVVRV